MALLHFRQLTDLIWPQQASSAVLPSMDLYHDGLNLMTLLYLISLVICNLNGFNPGDPAHISTALQP